MLRPSSFLLASSFALLFPCASEAQIVCTTDTKAITTDGLQLFHGWYKLSGAKAADGTDPRVLNGLDQLYIPKAIGQVFGTRKQDRHGNYFYVDETATVIRIANAHERIDLSDKLRTGRSAAWCTNKDRGYFYYRGGAAIDWRWKHDGEWWDIGDDFPLEYAGVRINTDLAFSGTGLPILAHSTDAKRATEHAERLYSKLDGNRAANFFTYELELGGVLQLYVHELPRCRMSPCYLNKAQTVKNPAAWTDTIFAYRRILQGAVRYRQYLDPRVGVPGYPQATRMEFTFDVSFTGDPLVVGNRSELKKFQNKYVIPYCGNPNGCGKGGASFAGLGGRFIEGSDHALRLAQMCRSANNGRDCFSNPQSANMNPSQSYITLATESGSGAARVTESQRTVTLSGQRKDSQGNSIAVPSQVDRYCLRRIEADSLDVMEGPLPSDVQRPTRYIPNPDDFPDMCWEFIAKRYDSKDPGPGRGNNPICFILLGREVCMPRS